MSKLRFGVVDESVSGGPGGPGWLDHVRKVEDSGVDVFLVRDHFSAAWTWACCRGTRADRGLSSGRAARACTSDRHLPAVTEIVAGL
jgi:hypothetical protein